MNIRIQDKIIVKMQNALVANELNKQLDTKKINSLYGKSTTGVLTMQVIEKSVMDFIYENLSLQMDEFKTIENDESKLDLVANNLVKAIITAKMQVLMLDMFATKLKEKGNLISNLEFKPSKASSVVSFESDITHWLFIHTNLYLSYSSLSPDASSSKIKVFYINIKSGYIPLLASVLLNNKTNNVYNEHYDKDFLQKAVTEGQLLIKYQLQCKEDEPWNTFAKITVDRAGVMASKLNELPNNITAFNKFVQLWEAF